MKNIRKYTQFAISAIIATLFITSCEDPVDIDYIDYEPLVVVNSINEVDSTLKMRLTYSRWFLDNQSFKEVDNANITLKVNGNTIGNATSTLINDKKYYTIESYTPQEGDMLQLDIQVPDEDLMTSSCTVPRKPEISDIYVTEIGHINEYEGYDYIKDSTYRYYDTNTYEYNVSFTLHDKPNEQNFYKIEVMSIGENNNHRHYVSIDDYIIAEEMSDFISIIDGEVYEAMGFLFSDSKINGKDYSIKLSFSLYGHRLYDYDETVIKISSISSDLYYYMLSMEKQSSISTIFGEPVQIHCNIENGIGIFGVTSPCLSSPLTPSNTTYIVNPYRGW